MKRTFLMVILLAGLLAFSTGNALSTVIVNFNPGSKYAGVGSTFNINITADVLAAEALVGWGFDLLFDPSQLALNSTSTSPYWDLMTFGSNNLTALLKPDPASPDPGLSGNGLLLATLNFTCLGPGTSALGIAVNPQDPIQGFMTFDGQYAAWQAIPGTIEQGSAVVPEPGTMLLLGCGLAGLAWFSRKKRKS